MIGEDSQVIEVKFRGNINTEDFKKSLDAILGIRQDQGLTKVLVDATKATSYPSTTSIILFGSGVAEPLRGIRLAIASPLKIQENPAFFETVTINRGAVVRAFDSADEALAWLKTEPNKELKTRL